MWLFSIFDHFPLKVIARVYPWRHEILQTRSLVFTIVKHLPKLQGFLSAQSSRYQPTPFDGCKQTAWFDHPLASPTHSPDRRRFIALVWPQSAFHPNGPTQTAGWTILWPWCLSQDCCFIWPPFNWSGTRHDPTVSASLKPLHTQSTLLYNWSQI